MAIERRRLHYSGHVQGVGFRMTARRIARPLGISGHARNLMDGRVEVDAQGESGSLDAFFDALLREMRENIQHVEVELLEVEPDLPGEFHVKG